MKFNVLLPATALLALVQAADVTIQYCGGKDYGDCVTRTSGHGDCVSLPDFNDRIQSVKIPENVICVFWDNFSCQGSHTGTFSAQDKADMKDWNNKISSYRCCSGVSWCGNGL
ncbi:putative Small secreted protein [Seiridium cardinale]